MQALISKVFIVKSWFVTDNEKVHIPTSQVRKNLSTFGTIIFKLGFGHSILRNSATSNGEIIIYTNNSLVVYYLL